MGWSSAAEAALTEGLYAVPIFIGSCLTLLACAFILRTYYKYEELRRHPNGIVATRTFFDASFAITLIVEQASRLSGQRSAVDCRAYSFFFELTLIGSELCFFLLSYDLYVALRNPFVNYKSNLKKYIVFVFLVSVIMASILVGTGRDVYGMTNFGQCWIKPVFEPVSGYMWAFFYWILIAVFLWSFFVLMYARRRLSKGLRETYEARMTSFYHGLAFVLGYAVFWLIVAIVYWISLPQDTSPERSNAAWVFCLFFTCRGMATMGCWLYNHKMREIAAKDRAARESGGKLGKVNRQLQPHLNLALRKEVLHYTTLAIRLSIMEAVGEQQMISMVTNMKGQLRSSKVETLRSRLNSSPELVQPRGGRVPSQRLPQVEPATPSRLVETGLLHDPDVIIAKSNPYAPLNDKNPNKSDTDLHVDWVPVNISLKAPLFERAGQFDIGEFTVQVPTTPKEKEGAKRPVVSPTVAVEVRGATASQQLSPPPRGKARVPEAEQHESNPTPTSAQEGGIIKRPPLELHDLAPQAFARIRDLFGITPAQFFYSLSRTTKERFSEGASGAFMCFSHDMKFVIKTMEKDEAVVLKRILPDYLAYLRKNRDSLIIKFYACMSLRLYSQTLYFVVMENIFPTRATIHERFDLKGSWVGRSAGKGVPGTIAYCRYCNESFKVGSSDSCKARPNRSHVVNTVLKDNDLSYKLRFNHEKAVRLGSQLRADAAFLARMGVMDYSLLVGVHNRKFRIDEMASPAIASPAANKWKAVEKYYEHLPAANGDIDVPKGAVRFSTTAAADDSPSAKHRTSSIQSDDPVLATEDEVDSEDDDGGIPDPFRVRGKLNAQKRLQELPSPVLRATPVRAEEKSVRLQETYSFAPAVNRNVTRRASAAITPGAEGYVPFFRNDEGGLSSSIIEGPGVFYMGIIDILQEWSFIKRAERWFKRYVMFQDKQGMSVIPPPDYATRFDERVITAIIEQDTSKLQVAATLGMDRRLSVMPARAAPVGTANPMRTATQR